MLVIVNLSLNCQARAIRILLLCEFRLWVLVIASHTVSLHFHLGLLLLAGSQSCWRNC